MLHFMKIRRVGGELFHADGRAQTDMTKLTVAFRNFTKAPNNWKVVSLKYYTK